MQLSQSILAGLLATLSLFPAASQAHLGKGMPGHHIQKKHHDLATPGFMARSPSPTPLNAGKMNDAQFAKIESPTTECKPYNYAPVDGFMNQFPTVWETADIMANDSAAQQLWAKVQASGIIPAGIKPKGTRTGSRTGVNYDSQTDPDCDWTAAKCTTPKHPNIPADIVSCPTPHTWGLTYDDGPNCSHNAFYDYLREQNQKASLYYIGSNTLDWPLQAQRGLTDGHFISVHTYSHPYMTALTNSQVFAELYYTIKAIKAVVGVTPMYWRPPFGDVDDRVRAIATALGLQTVIWTDDTSDYLIQPQGPSPTASINKNYASIIASATSPALETGGIIVLSHEINGDTIQEAMMEYPRISKAFKYVVPVEVCHNITKPYQESITYPDFGTYIKGTANRMPSGIPKANAIQAKVAQFTPSGSAAMQALGPAATMSGAALSSAAGNASSGGVAAAQGQSASGASAAFGFQLFAVISAAFAGAFFTLCL